MPKIAGVPDYDEALRQRLSRLGALLRGQRQLTGLSQEQLADRAGLHRTYVGSVERGERNISVGNLYRLADTLGVSIRELLCD